MRRRFTEIIDPEDPKKNKPLEELKKWYPCETVPVNPPIKLDKKEKYEQTKQWGEKQKDIWDVIANSGQKIKDPEQFVSFETIVCDSLNNTIGVSNETYTCGVTYIGSGAVLQGTIIISDVNDELAPPLPSLSIVQVTVSNMAGDTTEIYATYDDFMNFTSGLSDGNNTISITVIDEAGNAMVNCVNVTVIMPKPGGIGISVDNLGLLTSYVGLASTILVATVATAVYVKHVKRRGKK